MKPEKNPRGRKADFETRPLAGLPAPEIERAAALGLSAAVTSGAKLLQDHHAAYFWRDIDAKKANAKWTSVWASLDQALKARDSKFFREIADCIDALAAANRDGFSAKAPEVMHAARFVDRCRHQTPPYDPSFKDIHEYLCEHMEPAPDYNTARRAGKLLGISGRAGK